MPPRCGCVSAGAPHRFRFQEDAPITEATASGAWRADVMQVVWPRAAHCWARVQRPVAGAGGPDRLALGAWRHGGRLSWQVVSQSGRLISRSARPPKWSQKSFLGIVVGPLEARASGASGLRLRLGRLLAFPKLTEVVRADVQEAVASIGAPIRGAVPCRLGCRSLDTPDCRPGRWGTRCCRGLPVDSGLDEVRGHGSCGFEAGRVGNRG